MKNFYLHPKEVGLLADVLIYAIDEAEDSIDDFPTKRAAEQYLDALEKLLAKVEKMR